MELRYPYLIPIGLIIIGIVIFLNRKRKQNFNGGIKLANTQYIKKSAYYQKLMHKYQIILLVLKTSCLISIVLSLILIARPTTTKTIDEEKYNRDIILCMDVSMSVNSLNLELVDNLKEVVKKLKGERFGISIFNTSSVTLVPLTDDYDYVIDTLDKLKKSIDSIENNHYGDNFLYDYDYLMGGTLEDNETRGSSLIGDGLASCIYSFSSLDDNRTKIIIFSTDNDLAGTPLLTVEEAAKISKKKNVIVYGVAPSSLIKDKENFKNAIESTGGIYFDASSSNVQEIVSNIEKQSKSLMSSKIIKTKIDQPEMPFILLIGSSIMFLVLNKKVVL